MASSDLINVAADANQEILDAIKKAEGDEAELLKQVFDSFDSLGKLISQVIEAFKASKNCEKETNVTDMITDRIKKEIEETLKSKVEAKKKKEEEFQREIEEAERNLSEKRKDLDDKSKSKLRVWSAFLGIFQSEEESVEIAPFVENVESSTNSIGELEELESCAKTHHSAEVYVQCKKHLREDEASTDVRKAAEVSKPFGQRAKKSFPQPKRFKIPQPVLGKDPNHPEIEVVEYVEKVIAADQISGGEEPQQTPSIKASPVPESEQHNESPVHTPDQSVFNHPCPAQSPDQVTEIKPSPLYTSYRETSPPMQPCITAGPSGVKILSDEEMNRTVTSTTSLFTGGGTLMDEEDKRSLLASMKQAYTSELNQYEKTQGNESDASVSDSSTMPLLFRTQESDGEASNDSVTMPQLFKSPNLGYETDKSRPPPDLHFEDSFDEDFLAKKTLFVSCDSETDFGLDTPALTPLNPLSDELEAAMAKRHGESLNEEPEEAKMPPSSMTKIVKEQSTASRVGEINEENFEEKSEPKSTPIPRALSRHSREMKQLSKDEMVQNMLLDIGERGLNKRRISAINYKEFHSNGLDKEVRSPRRVKSAKKDDSSFDYELTPPRKKKMSRTTSTPVVDLSPQDQALQQWEPLLNSTNEDKVVYVPRKLANPADSSVIVGRRTFSSDSSADGNQNNKRKTIHSQEGSVQRSLFLLSDHSYTSVKSSHELGSA
ncbi:hypothetical protein DAPPUDRAFT_272994, partial [Daphnia pulex]